MTKLPRLPKLSYFKTKHGRKVTKVPCDHFWFGNKVSQATKLPWLSWSQCYLGYLNTKISRSQDNQATSGLLGGLVHPYSHAFGVFLSM